MRTQTKHHGPLSSEAFIFHSLTLELEALLRHSGAKQKGGNLMTKFLALLVVMLGSMRASPRITVESPLPWLAITADSQVVSKVANIPTSVLPYSVAVTNNGTEPIAGIDVLFTLTTAGRTVRRNFFYHSFGRNQPLISSGQSRVFTPLKSATAVASGNRGGSDTFDDAALTILASADTIHVSVDLVVAVDGRSAGADIAKTVKKLTP
jgi:hypothetical protein